MEYLLRSMLFVPAHNERFLQKAVSCDADALIFDMEDAVPFAEKESAGKLLDQYLKSGAFSGKTIFVRVNELSSGWLENDMELLKNPDMLGIVAPKIRSAEDIHKFERMLAQQETRNGFQKGKLRLLPLIETASAVMNIKEIASCSSRVIALLFGGEDYLDSVWGKHLEPPEAFDVPRAMIVMAARMNHILPIDTPYLDLKNEAGFVAEETASAALGFAGMLLVTPDQIDWANRCFSPSQEELCYAQAIQKAVMEEKDRNNIARLHGKLIGPPMIKRAEKILAVNRMINSSRREKDSKQESNG